MVSEQKEEIATIKPRNYVLKLSNADVERLAKRAGQYNMAAAELLENFVGDLVCGTYTNGSDERDFANQWAERCDFSFRPQRTLITFFCCDESSYELEQFFEILDDIEYIETDIQCIKVEIENPVQNWKDICNCHYDKETGESTYTPAYSTIDDYIAGLKEDLKNQQESLADETAQLQEIQKEFAEYMGTMSYSWEEQLLNLQAWYETSMPKPLQPDTTE